VNKETFSKTKAELYFLWANSCWLLTRNSWLQWLAQNDAPLPLHMLIVSPQMTHFKSK